MFQCIDKAILCQSLNERFIQPCFHVNINKKRSRAAYSSKQWTNKLINQKANKLIESK